jgi:hypothetical protein
LGRSIALCVTLLLATVAVVAAAQSAGAVPEPGTAEARFLILTNQARATAGLPPLVRDAGRDGVAPQWSSHMAAVFV